MALRWISEAGLKEVLVWLDSSYAPLSIEAKYSVTRQDLIVEILQEL